MSEEQEVPQEQKKKNTWPITIGICILLVAAALLIASRQKISVALYYENQF